MHIIVTREDVSKYGLQGMVDPKDEGSMSLDDLMGLLGHGPVTRPGLAAVPDHPLARLWVDTLRLRARIDAAYEKLPPRIREAFNKYNDDLGNVACELSTALAWDLDAKAREAEGLKPDGDDSQADQQQQAAGQQLGPGATGTVTA
jgi:hypothetical protein